MSNKFFRKIQLRAREAYLKQLQKTAGVYDRDGLISVHNHDFMRDSKFIKAYKRGVKANKIDYQIEWRIHIALWAASYASRLEGDFVDCGVNRGIFSSSIMEYLDWNKLHKKYYLLDTFCGIDEDQLSKEEIALGRIEEGKAMYPECFEDVKKNFSEFKNVIIIKGSIPSTLRRVKAKKVCYLSIDLNNAKPEIAAIEFFWPKLVRGGIVLLDDYAYQGYYPQKRAFDKFAKKKKIEILSLPTGQGMIIK